ncbi:MAG: transcriptional regulator, DeoR family [Firmicutes bacterium]|nr:transcriptional regulator, DeoR family [Bacillota bacterium]
MLAVERRQTIIDLIRKEQKVYVPHLSQQFNVTEETIRRDLEKLENTGILTRTYGGAILTQHTNEDLPFPTRTIMNHELKQAIAQKAAKLISDDDTIMVDASSTSLELIHAIKNKRNLTIITNSVKITHDFVGAPFTIISTGGILRPHSLALTGPVAHSSLQNYYVDIAIMSCKGLSLDKGIMESNEPESELKKSMISQAEKVILLADHTKFDKTAFIKLFGFEDIDYIVTDSKPSDEWANHLQKHYIELIY